MMPPRGSLRGALPGLLVMALIAAAGTLFAVGVREVLPRDFLETDPFEGLSAEDIAIDEATGLPIVPTVPYDEVITWGPTQPNSRIDPANTWASDIPAGGAGVTQPTVSLLATYATHEAARDVAEGLAAAVGDPLAEASWLRAAGVEPGDGFGWLGSNDPGTPFVQVVDRRLLVDGLEWRESYEPPPELDEAGATPGPSETSEPPTAPPAADASYGAPLAQALAASGAVVLVEGDRQGEGAIAFDLVCIGEAGALVTLGQDLADAVTAAPGRPPWLGLPLTTEERTARRTQRLVVQLWASAFIGDVMRSGEMERLSEQLAAAVERDDEDATAAASAAIQAHLAELVPTRLPDLGPLADAIDPDVLVATMAELTRTDLQAANASIAPDDAGAGGGEEALATDAVATDAVAAGRDGRAHYDVLADGRRLWLTLGSWSGISQGFGPFVQYLDANGCDDIRVVLYDYDDVRQD